MTATHWHCGLQSYRAFSGQMAILAGLVAKIQPAMGRSTKRRRQCRNNKHAARRMVALRPPRLKPGQNPCL
jgi:hypothetical protein